MKSIFMVMMILLIACAGFVGNKLYADKQILNKPKASLGYSESGKSSEKVRQKEFQTAKVQQNVRNASIRLIGNLIGDETSNIASNIAGIVEKVMVERGSMAEKGDILVQLDATDAKNKLAEGTASAEELKVRLGLDDFSPKVYDPEKQPEVKAAKASLTLSEANYKRYSSLYLQNGVSKSDYDRMQNEYDLSAQRYQQAVHQAKQLYQSYQTALTRLTTLRKLVKDTAITAPFSGWVAEKYVSSGERVGEGAKVINLVRINPLRLVLTVPQQYVSLIRPEQTVNFQVDSFPDKTFTAKVRYIAPSVEEDSRSLMVEAVADNKDKMLLPGLFATAELILEEKSVRLAVPEKAVQKQGEITKVYVLREGIAREQIISVEETDNYQVYITSGLDENDTVILSPESLKDGDRIF
jgi:RND family efflux transporter MFP subunit